MNDSFADIAAECALLAQHESARAACAAQERKRQELRAAGLVGATDAAKVLGVALRTFQRWRDEGRLPAPVEGRRPRLWRQADLAPLRVVHGPKVRYQRRRSRKVRRRRPRCPVITLTAHARTHVLACRNVAGQTLWHPGDLALRLKHASAAEPEPGKEPHSHVCLPVDSPPMRLP